MCTFVFNVTQNTPIFLTSHTGQTQQGLRRMLPPHYKYTIDSARESSARHQQGLQTKAKETAEALGCAAMEVKEAAEDKREDDDLDCLDG